ncbi:MAG: ATP-dependent DNA ligase [Myxococcota bacterium]
MSLDAIVQASLRVKSTRSRKAKTQALADGLRAVSSNETRIAAMYLAGELPQGKIGVGYAKVMALKDVPAASSTGLSLAHVDRVMTEVKAQKGAGSNERRLRALSDLLQAATLDEQHFLRRLWVGEIRQGALQSLVIDAIAHASELPADRVRRAQMVAGDLGAIATAALSEGASGLARFRLSVFTPIEPMLAQTAETVEDALERLENAAFELKLDGARVQVHKDHDNVRVYSRRLNEVTPAVPEVVEVVRALPARRLILDGETIALSADGRPLPFQTTMRRYGRRLDVDEMRKKLPLSTFFFDVLLVDDDDLLDRSARERHTALASLTPDAHRVDRIVTADPAEATAFVSGAFSRGHEGAMAKSLHAFYDAGSRGAGWLKLKQAHTLDLVVIAAEWGSGRRQGWLSNLHLAARDESSGEFVMLGKTFKGLTDKILTWQTEQLLAREVARDGHIVRVKPELVVEIAFNDLQTSSQYPGGMALRFARVKQYRADKTADQADTLTAVRAIYEASLGAS